MKKSLTYSCLLVYIRVYELIVTLKHKQNMSSTINNTPSGLSGFSLDPDFTGCPSDTGLGQSGPPSSLRYRIEKELVGVPSHVQKDALLHLLHLLGEESASHQKKL